MKQSKRDKVWEQSWKEHNKEVKKNNQNKLKSVFMVIFNVLLFADIYGSAVFSFVFLERKFYFLWFVCIIIFGFLVIFRDDIVKHIEK